MELMQVKIERRKKEDKVEKRNLKIFFKKLRKFEEEKIEKMFLSFKNIARGNTLGPLCLWQCFI